MTPTRISARSITQVQYPFNDRRLIELLMRCILHIGTEKTGTTALQAALSSQRTHLSRNGVWYAKAPGDFNCRSLAAAFTSPGNRDDYMLKFGLTEPEKFAEWRRKLLGEIRQEITTARDGCNSYILSSEHFSSRVMRDADVADLAEYLRAEFEDIRVVCYLRRQDLMATSRINERLRAGFPQRSFPTVKEDGALPPLYDYQALINRWSLAFGESAMKVRIFERPALTGGSIVTDFAETQLGVPLKQADHAISNVSLSLSAQMALLMFNQAMGLESRFHVAKQRRELAKYLEEVAPGSDGKPSRSRALSFYEYFREGNNRLANLYFQRDQLFDERFEDYPEHELKQDIKLAASLLSDFYMSRFIS